MPNFYAEDNPSTKLRVKSQKNRGGSCTNHPLTIMSRLPPPWALYELCYALGQVLEPTASFLDNVHKMNQELLLGLDQIVDICG